ncbi:hypothetical protein BV898_10575 [Hypsibius exemplaris]|uniref:Uncharacterized protein n=1 Tax=Hypsibius exemplaris TaxID=2072580 RepID=A0A1W0WIZ1_HYPEX|nr:hypothetical protein BV898_10575 [Hypsibius exemplaris]
MGDSSSLWHSEHAKLKRQMRGIRNLLESRQSAGQIDSQVSEEVLEGIQRLSDQLEEVKGVVVQNTLGGAGDGPQTKLPRGCRVTCIETEQEDPLRRCEGDLIQCRVENKELKEELRELRKKHRGVLDEDCGASSEENSGDCRLKNCFERLKLSEETNRKLCRKLKTLHNLLGSGSMASQLSSWQNAWTEASQTKSDERLRRCFEELNACQKENKKLCRVILQLRKDLAVESRRNVDLAKAKDEVVARNQELTEESDEMARRLVEADKNVGELEAEVRRIQIEFAQYKQVAELN